MADSYTDFEHCKFSASHPRYRPLLAPMWAALLGCWSFRFRALKTGKSYLLADFDGPSVLGGLSRRAPQQRLPLCCLPASRAAKILSLRQLLGLSDSGSPEQKRRSCETAVE